MTPNQRSLLAFLDQTGSAVMETITFRGGPQENFEMHRRYDLGCDQLNTTDVNRLICEGYLVRDPEASVWDNSLVLLRTEKQVGG